MNDTITLTLTIEQAQALHEAILNHAAETGDPALDEAYEILATALIDND